MNRLTMSLSLLLVLPLMLPAQAQQRRHRNVGIATLVGHRAVHKELKVTDEQKDALKEASAEARKEFKGIQKLKDEERRAKNREVNQKLRKAINATLKAEQKKRLLQIEIQYSGVWILRRKEVSTSLELTRDQRREISELAKKSQQESQKLRATLNDDNRRDVQRKIAEGVAATRKAALKLLTDEQQKKWKEVTGETFELPRRGRKKRKKKKNQE